MIGSSLLALGFFHYVLAALWLLCAIILILIVLVQKGKGGGLSGALGGGMASGILGSKTGDFLTWFTIVVAALFLTFSVLMVKFYKPNIHREERPMAPSTQPQQPPQAPPMQPLDTNDTAAVPEAEANLPVN